MRKSRFLYTLAAPGAIALGLIFAPVASAIECIPSPGQEYIAPTYAVQYEYLHTTPGTEPQGEETIPNPEPATIPNPEYQGPTTTIVHHDAEYATEYLYIKQVRGIIQQKTGWGGWVNTGETFDWETWSGNLTRWESADFTEAGPHNAVQSQDGKKRKVTTEYRYVQTGETRQGAKIKDDWDEEVTTPGNGLPETIPNPNYTGPTIPNPDYIPGTDPTTELVWHDADWVAPDNTYEPTGNTRSGEGITEMIDPGQEYIAPVVCEPETPVEPEQPAEPENPVEPIDQGDDEPTPVVTPSVTIPVTVTAPVEVAKPAQANDDTELAHTGADLGALGAAGAMIAAGAAAVGGVAYRRRHMI